jgi:KUP system potassium uptake protein
VARLFGPVCVLWFLTLAGLGLWHVGDGPPVLASFNPTWGLGFLSGPGVAFVVLGAVFLAVTGGEALYADLGHFGRGRSCWPGSRWCCPRWC